MTTKEDGNGHAFVAYCELHREAPPKYANRTFFYKDKHAPANNANANTTEQKGQKGLVNSLQTMASTSKAAARSLPDLWWLKDHKTSLVVPQVTSVASSPGKPKLKPKTPQKNRARKSFAQNAQFKSQSQHTKQKTQMGLGSFFGKRKSADTVVTTQGDNSLFKRAKVERLVPHSHMLMDTATDAPEEDDGEQYCVCRSGWNKKEFMIGCDKCDEWFHGICVNLLPDEGPKIEEYHCASCADPPGKPYKRYKDGRKPWWLDA
jgi:hypothetical protein